MVTVTQIGSNSYTRNPNATGPGLRPAATSLNVPLSTANTEGDWMFAVVTWQAPYAINTGLGQTFFDENTTISVADDAHNWWEPLSPGQSTSPASVTRVSIWCAPAALVAGNVMIAPNARIDNVVAVVLNVHGLSPWLTITGATSAFTIAGTSVSASAGPSATPAFYITAFGADNANAIPVTTGASWTVLPTTSATGSGLNVTPAWQVVTGSAAGGWTSSGPANLAVVTGGVIVAGTAPLQPNPAWPATIAELALGSGPNTPADQMTWTPCTSRFLSMTVQQGRQYQLQALQPAQGSVTLDNFDGAFEPPGTAPYAGIDSGTPFRVRMAWTGGTWNLSWQGNGTTTQPGANGSTKFSVIPNQGYIVNAWLGSSAPWSGGMVIAIEWLTSGNAFISETISSETVTGPGATLAFASGTAPSNAAFATIQLRAQGTPPSSTVFYAADAYSAGTANGYLNLPPAVTWSATGGATVTRLGQWNQQSSGPPSITPWAVPFSGFVQNWPQQWDPASLRGFTEATITDAFGYLTSNLQPILQQEILNTGPYAYWPCTDAAGSQAASNVAPGNSNPLRIVGSKYGSGGGSSTFGANGSALLGAQGTIPLTNSVRVASQSGMWQQTFQGQSQASNVGSGLIVADAKWPPPKNGVTIEYWFQCNLNAAPANYRPVLFALGNENPGGNLYTLWVGSVFTTVGLTVAGTWNNGVNLLDATTNYWAQTTPTHIALLISDFAWTTYINGRQITNAGGTNVWMSTSGSQSLQDFYLLSFGGAIGEKLANGGATGGWQQWAFPGSIGHVAVWSRFLSQNEINDHYQAGIAGMAQDYTTSRIERILQSVPYGGRRAIVPESTVTATQVVSCQDISGQAASISVANIATNVTPGNVWNTPGGDLYYQPRSSTYNQGITWVVGDRPDLGELQFTNLLIFGYDPTHVANNVQLTQLDNQDVITPSGPQEAALISKSQMQYGTLSYWVTGYLEGDLFTPYNYGPGLFDLANWIVSTNAVPMLRIQNIVVDASSQPRAWQFVTRASPGDTIQVNYRPVTAGGKLFTVTGRISQTSRSFSYGAMTGQVTASLTLLIDPMPEQSVLTADDPVLGQLDGTHILGW